MNVKINLKCHVTKAIPFFFPKIPPTAPSALILVLSIYFSYWTNSSFLILNALLYFSSTSKLDFMLII